MIAIAKTFLFKIHKNTIEFIEEYSSVQVVHYFKQCNEHFCSLYAMLIIIMVILSGTPVEKAQINQPAVALPLKSKRNCG